MNFPTSIAAILLSGVLLFLSLPPWDLSCLSWFALTPLYLAILDKRPFRGFVLGFLTGTLYFSGISTWLFEVPSYRLHHHIVLILYLGMIIGLFAMGVCFIAGRLGLEAGLLAAPFIWVSQEYVRSNLSFLALPWGLLAHSQYRHPVILQVASITGTYGLSFLIAMVNAALCVPVVASRFTHKNPQGPPRHRRYAAIARAGLVALAGVLAGTALIRGHFTVSQPIGGDGVRVAVVQGNIEQAKKWDRAHARFIMETYGQLTEEAARDKPALIVWPEAATPGPIDWVPSLYRDVKQIAQKAGTFLLIGSSGQQKFAEGGLRGLKSLNSAFLIPPGPAQGEDQRYDKIRLLPFGECLPFRGIIPWSLLKVPQVAEQDPGSEIKIFTTPKFRFGVSICWENIFGDFVRQFVAGGAQFMVNITNEAWFGKTAASVQFLSMSVLRAVENRVFVVRCGNTGISCVIDPYGRVIDRVKDGSGQDIFVRGVMSAEIVPLDYKTFYTCHGEWAPKMGLICCGGFLLCASRRKVSKLTPSFQPMAGRRIDELIG